MVVILLLAAVIKHRPKFKLIGLSHLFVILWVVPGEATPGRGPLTTTTPWLGTRAVRVESG